MTLKNEIEKTMFTRTERRIEETKGGDTPLTPLSPRTRARTLW